MLDTDSLICLQLIYIFSEALYLSVLLVYEIKHLYPYFIAIIKYVSTSNIKFHYQSMIHISTYTIVSSNIRLKTERVYCAYITCARCFLHM